MVGTHEAFVINLSEFPFPFTSRFVPHVFPFDRKVGNESLVPIFVYVYGKMDFALKKVSPNDCGVARKVFPVCHLGLCGSM